MTAAVALGGCGGATPENDDLLTGSWQVSELVVADTAIDLAQSPVVIDLSTAQRSVRADTSCHWLYGSFTILRDGSATFTMPGRSTQSCEASDQLVEDALLGALDSVRSWQLVEDRLVFASPTVRLELSPTG
ncbi:MAG: hypothetical protein ACI8TP_000256 [Acidimicrobiales bacterium]|jgi:hypothetical protein